MSMTLQLAVARGTARGLINGTAAADYGDVICLRQLLLREGEHGLATDLLVLAKAMSPTAAELSEYGLRIIVWLLVVSLWMTLYPIAFPARDLHGVPCPEGPARSARVPPAGTPENRDF